MPDEWVTRINEFGQPIGAEVPGPTTPIPSFITLAVGDLGASRRFYVECLGWEPSLDQAGEVLMFEVSDKLILSLWDAEAFTAVERDWGRCSGYFVDPDGFRWEICHNPGVIGAKVLP